MTVITYGAMVQQSLEAAAAVAKEGIETEILDLRTLSPLDVDAIVAAAEKTGKVCIVHEATQTGGLGGEIAALIAERAFRALDAPILRVTAPDTPVPFSPPLEDAYLPKAEKIAARLRELATF